MLQASYYYLSVQDVKSQSLTPCGIYSLVTIQLNMIEIHNSMGADR